MLLVGPHRDAKQCGMVHQVLSHPAHPLPTHICVGNSDRQWDLRDPPSLPSPEEKQHPAMSVHRSHGTVPVPEQVGCRNARSLVLLPARALTSWIMLRSPPDWELALTGNEGKFPPLPIPSQMAEGKKKTTTTNNNNKKPHHLSKRNQAEVSLFLVLQLSYKKTQFLFSCKLCHTI